MIDIQPPGYALTELLAELRKLDVRLWLDGERLRVNAPAGTLTLDLQAELTRRKPELVSLLSDAQQNSLDSTPKLGPVQHTGPLPLSFSQQRLWFLDQLSQGNAAYNIVSLMRLRGQLHVPALQRSLTELLRRHAALRTRFVVNDGQPTQVVEPPAPMDLVLHDLRDFDPSERLAQAASQAWTDANRPFDLRHAPLWRAGLFQAEDQLHVLALSVHHIVADGWSLGILSHELSELYAAFLEGRPSPLAELPIQYVDFAVWQRAWLHHERLPDQLAYWVRQLAGPLPVLDLPTDHPRPASPSGRGSRLFVTLDAALVEKLRAFSRAEGATLFMALLAAFNVLLHRLTLQEDIVVGTPVAGRKQLETEGVVGCFINSLVLRTDLSGEPSFRDLLTRVQRVALEAFSHQDVPFEKLVETLHTQRDTSRAPLFQVVFSLQNMPLDDLHLPGLDVEQLRPTGETSRNDLTFEVYERPSGLEIGIEYATDLFDAATVQRMARQYETVLRTAMETPDEGVTHLPILTETERQQLVVEWNQTASEYPHQDGVHHLVERQAERVPEAPAVCFGEQSISYAELNERANRLARYLQALGVGSRSIVGVHLDRSLDMVVALLGVLKAGGAYLPLDPAFPSERLVDMLHDSQADVVVTDARLAEAWAAIEARVVRLDTDWPGIEAEYAASNLEWSPMGDQVAYVLYTSGSTGRPKGVQVTHHNVVNFLTSMRKRPGLTAEDTLLSVTTLSFDIAGLELFLPLSTGARVVLVSSAVAADGPRLLAALDDSGATVMQATPATWRLLLAAGWQGSPGLRVLCGGEALPAQLAAQLIPRCDSLWNLYGPTETTIWSTVHPVTAIEPTIPIGRPIANTRLYVLDAYCQPVPRGVAGELYIAGDGVALGYLRRPELTAERFVLDPFGGEPDARMYRTGDRVRYRSDASLEYLERVDTQVKLRGYRIELGEIERVLEQQPGVRQAAVALREDTPDDQRLVAYVTTGGSIDLDDVRAGLRSRLPTYMVPAAIVSLAMLPLTPNGKLDRKALPPPDAQSLAADRGRSVVAPRTATERIIAAIWSEVLDVPNISIHDNFFDLGGHSLLIVRVHDRVRQALNAELSVAEMFQYPTVETLAQHVQRLPAETARADRAQDRAQRLRAELGRRRSLLPPPSPLLKKGTVNE